MNKTFFRIRHIAFSEIRSVRRLTRFWVVMSLLTLICWVAYFFSTLFYQFLAPFSPSFGATTPFYVLSYIDPTFFLFFQIATLFLLFDSRHRHFRDRIDQVLDAKPPKTIEYLLGRIFGISFLIWAIVAGNLLLLNFSGSVSKLFGFDFSEMFQIHSLINLLIIDVPSMLVFWATFTVFLSTVLRYRVLILVMGLTTMMGWFYFIHQLPFSLYSLAAPSSNDTLFVSDLLPQFASLTSISVRVASLIFALSLLYWACNLSSRSESEKAATKLLYASCALVLSCTIFGFVAMTTLSNNAQIAEWKQFHKNTTWDHQIDLITIGGNIEINPKRKLSGNLKYTFQIHDTPIENQLLFSLNAGMKVESVQLNDQNSEFTFENGLLTIRLQNVLEPTVAHSIQISYSGVPHPRFAYLDEAFDFLNDRFTHLNTPRVLGTEGSLFHAQYVALMPGAYWYPIPGAIKTLTKPLAQTRDFFEVDVRIRLNPPNWQLVVTSDTQEIEPGQYRVQSLVPVSEIGIFASDFSSVATEIQGVQLSMFTHSKHGTNLALFETLDGDRREALESIIQTGLERGLTTPNQSLTFVEIPRALRTVGGGWRMHSVQSLPGVILMKEHGFPRANLKRNLARVDKNLTESKHLQKEIVALKQYFDVGASTAALKTNLVLQSWNHLTAAMDERAVVLDSVIVNLIGMLNWRIEINFKPGFYLFSVHATAGITRELGIHGDTAVWGFESALEGNPGQWAVDQLISGDNMFSTVISNKTLVYENVSLLATPTKYGHKVDLEHLLFKSSQIAWALYKSNSRFLLANWIIAMQKDFKGRNYTFEELQSHANAHDVIIDPFLTDWIDNGEAPGYRTSRATVTRIADDESEHSKYYQTSVYVHNSEPTSGIVSLQWHQSEWGGRNETDPTLVSNDSTVLVSFTSDEVPRFVRLNPYYSQNRYLVPIEITHSDQEEIVAAQSSTAYASTEWQPEPPKGIIVDNLDDGFSVLNQQVETTNLRKLGPTLWFDSAHLMDAGMYENLQVVDPVLDWRRPNDQWYLYRMFGWFEDANPYGVYERSMVEARGDSTPSKARFSATLPKNGRWNLEYYWPWKATFTDNRYGEAAWRFKLQVLNAQVMSTEYVDVQALQQGWNLLATFYLDEGEVHVDLGTDIERDSGTERGYVVADAIRWLEVLEE